MNRLKLWLYLALLLCAGAANLVGLSRWLTRRAIAQVDRELTHAVAQVDARSRLLAMEAAHLADAVARDPAALQALSSEGEAHAASVAQAAAQSARGSAADPATTLLVAISGRGWRTSSVNGAPVQSDPQLDSLVSGAAADAARREGYVVVGDALYYLVATPAGRGAAVAVGVPAGSTWLALLRMSTGADVTLLLDQRPPRGTLSPDQSQLVANAVHGGTGVVSVGTLPSQPASFGVPLPAPSLPLLFASAPAYRANPVALRGLPGGVVVLSQPMGPPLAPVVGYVWVALAGLVILLLGGVGTALSITDEQETVVPKDLLAAADRITRRDFTARAPVMAGSLGTVAAALNCAAEAARSAGAIAEPAPFQGAVAEASPAHDADAGEPHDAFAGLFAPHPQEEPAAEPSALPEPMSAEVPASLRESPAAQESPAPLEQAAGPATSGGLDSAPEEAPADAPAAVREPSAAEASMAAFPAAAAPEPAAAEPAAADETAEPPMHRLSAQVGELFTAAAPEPEPAPGAEPLTVPPLMAPAAENGALAHAPEPDGSLYGPLGAAPTGAAGLAARESLLEPEPAPAPRPEPTPQSALRPAEPPPAEPAPVPALDGDEEHWRVTYDEFLKVREQCGESRQGIPYDRFRLKLQKNREQLVAKYGCRTVRFQVYVKEGRAALKASPVR
jgi:hypothetical protein